MNKDLKIVFAGPPQSGKTELADLISAASKSFQGNTKPTVCVRILEFSTTIDLYGNPTTISAQIWDTSGEEKYLQTWPAIAHNADGVVFVYNAFEKSHGRAIENYAKHFAKGVPVHLVLLIAHKIGQSDQKPLRAKLPKPIDTAQVIVVDAKDPLDDFNNAFNRFLERVQQAKVNRIEESERALVGEPAKAEADEEPPEESPDGA
jgi:Rab-like protein 5